MSVVHCSTAYLLHDRHRYPDIVTRTLTRTPWKPWFTLRRSPPMGPPSSCARVDNRQVPTLGPIANSKVYACDWNVRFFMYKGWFHLDNMSGLLKGTFSGSHDLIRPFLPHQAKASLQKTFFSLFRPYGGAATMVHGNLQRAPGSIFAPLAYTNIHHY